MIKKYVKKPVEVRAKQYDGTNLDAIKAFAGDALTTTDSGLPALKTRDGAKPLNVSDWVIVNPSGEAYITPAHKFHAHNDHVDGDVYRKKPVEQDVILFDGTEESFREIAEFGKTVTPPRIAHDYDAQAGTCKIPRDGYPEPCVAHKGDYIIRNGESVYPCSPDVFHETYVPAE